MFGFNGAICDGNKNVFCSRPVRKQIVHNQPQLLITTGIQSKISQSNNENGKYNEHLAFYLFDNCISKKW